MFRFASLLSPLSSLSALQEQASWVCGCDLATVSRLEESFKSTLQQQASLESWAGWLEGVAESILRYEMILSYPYFIIVKLSSSSAY